MRRLRAWFLRCAALFNRQRHESELAEELDFHLAQHIADRLQAGMTPHQARRDAVISLGGLDVTKEHYRDRLRISMIDAVMRDLRHTLRLLRKSPAFTIAAVLSLSLGVGASTGVYSVINAILLHPYPYQGADRMAVAALTTQGGLRNFLMVTAPQFEELQKADVLDGVLLVEGYPVTLTDGEFPEPVIAMSLSPNAFEYYGLPLFLGRGFTSEDGPLGGKRANVVVLGYDFWHSHYGGRTDVVGQLLHANREAYTIIGVASPELTASSRDLIFVPLGLTLDPKSAWMVQSLRVKRGVTLEVAEARLQLLLNRFALETPARFPRDFRLQLTGLYDSAVAPAKPPLILLLVATMLLLMIASANVSTLLIARGRARQHEFAVRGALGASRGRLFAQSLTESLVLSVVGASLGVALAYVGVPIALRWLPENGLPLVPATVEINASVLLVGLGLAIATGIACGLSPAFLLSRASVGAVLQANQARTTTGLQAQRAQHMLIASQVALTVVLLAGTGAAIRGFLTLYQTTLGYDPAHVLLFNVHLPEDTHTNWTERAAFYERLRAEIARLPDVQTAALSVFTGVPPITGNRRPFEVGDQAQQPGGFILAQIVSPEYRSVLRIPLREGRVWSTTETLQAARIAVVNETMGRQLWPGESPIGKRLRLPDFKSNNKYVLAATGDVSSDWLEIVGVVGDSLNRGLREPVWPSVYVPYTLLTGDVVTFAVRTRGDPLPAERAVREAVGSIDPRLAILKVRTAERDLNDIGWARERFVAGLLVALGVFSLMLAALGLYSAVSYSVSRQSKEFGIRIALGENRASTIISALRSGLVPSGAGLILGYALCIGSNKIIARWAIGNVSDPALLGVVTIVLLTVIGAAASIPANRAASIQPARALRVD